MDVKKTSDAVLDEKPHLKRTFKPTWKLYRKTFTVYLDNHCSPSIGPSHSKDSLTI